MAQKKAAIIAQVILLFALVGGAYAAVQAVSAWEQANTNGFGDSEVFEVSALEPFNGYLYAGTYNPNPVDPFPQFDGAQIWRASDGDTWIPMTEPGFGNNHDTAPPAILDLSPFKGYLYAATGRGDAAQIWRSQSGTNWSKVVNAGFGDPDIVAFTTLAVYNQALYVGATKQDSGAQIWRTLIGDGTLSNWTQVAPAVPMTDTASVTGFAVFDDGSGAGLYAAIAFEADSPAQIWRSYGGAWETIVSDGFGDSNTTATGGMAVFAGDLYVGAGNTASGAQLWRSSDGENWVPAPPAFGDANNEKVEMVFVFQNQLYAGVTNTATGIEIWRTADGALWEQANLDGFGDSKNTTTNGSNATADFLGQLYVGTSNVVDGGELWRMQQPYGVALSADQSLSGLAGGQVIYSLTITNSGNMADSFDLTATGQTWTTTLSTSPVNLAPSASAVFTVTVDIPPGAADQESDTVTITAISQGDSNKKDSAVLTTTNASGPVYGVALSADQAKFAIPGQSAAYTLIITNSGSITDTLNLTASGNNWPANLSDTSLTLGPGLGAPVEVVVNIPSGTANNVTDVVSITATSQGETGKSATARLTTTSAKFLYLYCPIALAGG